MTEQSPSGTMAEAAGDTGAHELDVRTGLPHVHEAHHGRRSSWVAVSIIVVGFIVGGIAMVPHPRWWLVWVGGGIVVVGALMATATHILDDWY